MCVAQVEDRALSSEMAELRSEWGDRKQQEAAARIQARRRGQFARRRAEREAARRREGVVVAEGEGEGEAEGGEETMGADGPGTEVESLPTDGAGRCPHLTRSPSAPPAAARWSAQIAIGRRYVAHNRTWRTGLVGRLGGERSVAVVAAAAAPHKTAGYSSVHGCGMWDYGHDYGTPPLPPPPSSHQPTRLVQRECARASRSSLLSRSLSQVSTSHGDSCHVSRRPPGVPAPAPKSACPRSQPVKPVKSAKSAKSVRAVKPVDHELLALSLTTSSSPSQPPRLAAASLSPLPSPLSSPVHTTLTALSSRPSTSSSFPTATRPHITPPPPDMIAPGPTPPSSPVPLYPCTSPAPRPSHSSRPVSPSWSMGAAPGVTATSPSGTSPPPLAFTSCQSSGPQPSALRSPPSHMPSTQPSLDHLASSPPFIPVQSSPVQPSPAQPSPTLPPKP